MTSSLTLYYTREFKKDYKRLLRSGVEVQLLQDVIETLADGNPLDPSYLDHALRGEYVGYRECHIRFDWLLVYRVDHQKLILTLTRTGTHQQIFGR